jgi:hypothetical protein
VVVGRHGPVPRRTPVPFPKPHDHVSQW